MLERWSFTRNLKGIHAMSSLKTWRDTEDGMVSSKPMILRYLREIRSDNLTLSLSPANLRLERHFTTRILRVEGERILLHQLTPGDWREVIHDGERVVVSCQLASGAIRFAARLSPLDDGGMTYCLLTLPEKVDRRQLRAFFRVSLLQYDARFHASFGDGKSFSGKVLDLSMGGLSCLADPGAAILAKGEVLADCRMAISAMPEVRFEAMVCHAVKINESGAAKIGLKFVALSADGIGTVRRTIARVERENIRRRAAM